ncbi:DNA-directed RNA polymerase subunit beta [Geodia barretti]|uniref:DNA-directed RNA polymerase subunit beta n=1 Tax=Geodia barretti TaxID=519541 RepID=A0AA35X074_GEOBA|nr:DNA-directed RNA polymerase subunit beta [Geodia barretti]
MTSTALQVRNDQNGAISKRSYSRIPAIISVPNLIQVQLDSFEHFKNEGLGELFDEISPIEDFPSSRFELTLGDHYFESRSFSEEECRERESTLRRPST